ncbi:MAG: RIP metalloprotease RseP [Bdellovibrionales bacterium]|nr:RIP metalloprotease RseP [Bdellovibrionales bacterium]
MSSMLEMLNTTASYIGPFFILLGLLIFVHELGHFLVAKYFGVKVEVFSLGFGKKIFQYIKGDTNYCISIIPLGGYVKMYGDDPTAEIPDNQKHLAFLHKPVGARIAIVLAGPLMNLIFAALIFSVVGMLGEKMAAPILGDIKKDSQAYEWGFRSGMEISKINDTTVQTWDDIENQIKAHANQELTFTYSNNDSSSGELTAKPTLGNNDNILSAQRQVGTIEGLTPISYGATVGVSDISSPAAIAGMTAIEQITKINGIEIKYQREMENKLEEFVSNPEKYNNLVIEAKSLIDKDKDPQPRNFEFDKTQLDITSRQNLFTSLGFKNSELFLYQIKEDSPADKAGLKAGDQLVAVNSKPIDKWEVIVEEIKSYNGNGKPVSIDFIRSGEQQQVNVVPQMTELVKNTGAEDNRFTIGIIPTVLSTMAEPILIRYSNPLVALQKGLSQSWKWTKMVAMSFVRMLQNEVSSKNIGGVITIGKYAGQSYQVGLSPFLKLMAIISINLFLINLLPVPILDGGHLLFFTIEAIRGAPLSMRKMEIAQQIGLIILMSLMVFALFNDISNILNPPW